MTISQAQIDTIAVISTPFRQKFAIPRQPNLANAEGIITPTDTYSAMDMVRGLEGFSHLWLLFLFHENMSRGWKPLVKAPRLGGNIKTGVLATRSTHRPNNIGMSVVKNLGVEKVGNSWQLNVSGVDLLDKTPIIDIKPYLPYADNIPTATDSLTKTASIPQRTVAFSTQAQADCMRAQKMQPDLYTLIIQLLAQDPRPAYRHNLETDDKVYSVQLYTFDVRFVIENGTVVVKAVDKLATP